MSKDKIKSNFVISIVVPVYNEQATIEELLKRVVKANTLGFRKQIIVVNDGSKDSTLTILKKVKKKISLLSHKMNRGKGAAIQTGLKKATGDVILVQDGDLEYNPKDIIKLLKVYDPQKNPVVYGSRNLGSSPKGYFLTHSAGTLINNLFNLLYGTSLTDLHTGYKLFRADIIKNAQLKSTGFDFCHEITAKAVRGGYRIKEVPISYSARSWTEGKKVRPKDAFIDIWTTIKLRFRST